MSKQTEMLYEMTEKMNKAEGVDDTILEAHDLLVKSRKVDVDAAEQVMYQKDMEKRWVENTLLEENTKLHNELAELKKK